MSDQPSEMCGHSTAQLFVALIYVVVFSTYSESQNVTKVSKPVEVFLPPKATPVLGKLVLAADTREPLSGKLLAGGARYTKWQNPFGRAVDFGTDTDLGECIFNFS